MIKNYSLSVLIFILPLAILLRLVLSSASTIAKFDLRDLRGFVKALTRNLLNLTAALNIRKRVQSKRIMGDAEIMARMIPNPLEFRRLLTELLTHRHR